MTSRSAEHPTAVVVLAGGEGTRMRSATPKVLHAVGGRSLLGHALHAAAGTGPEHLVVVVGSGREEVGTHCEQLGAELGRPVRATVQVPCGGTGHAVLCGLAGLPADATGTVLVVPGDAPLLDAATLRALHAEHAASGHAVTRLTVGGADAGVHAADLDALRAVSPGSSGSSGSSGSTGSSAFAGDPAGGDDEVTLADVVATLPGGVGTVEVTDAWLVAGVDDRVALAAVGAELNRRVLEGWMRAGVTVVDPARTWVDVDVRLARDVTLLPGTGLHGRSVVDEGATIGPDTTLTDVTVGSRATVVRTHGSASRIGAETAVGPFAYLRPGVELDDRAKIGTFVEVKNSRIGEGSKVPHLTYVGDADIGEGSNIGASSVFVNYDGVAKHRTVVGSHVRTGSDNTFVAPVTVGDGAYTGAGTVVREDVPPGALGVSSGPQRTIEGWVERKRAGTAPAEAAAAARAARGRPDEEEQ